MRGVLRPGKRSPGTKHGHSSEGCEPMTRVDRLLRTVVVSITMVPVLAAAETTTNTVLEFIDARHESTARVARTLWEYAELGYQETRSSSLLQEVLADESFEIEAGVAGMPTAFVASYGKTGPIVAILAEYDALPGFDQDVLPYRSAIAGKFAGHACGHNLFASAAISGAIAVKHWLERSGAEGVIRVYGTPAEEGGSGKAYMVRDGLFDDVDVALHWHPGGANTAAAESSLAVRSAKFRFSGVAAHAAFAAHVGRSALDGVEAFNAMVNLMREHISPYERVHYIISAGGAAPNVVPEFAEAYYYLRHVDVDGLRSTWTRLEDAARGAALGTGTEVEWEIIHGNYPIQVNETLARMVDQKLRIVGGVTYTEEEEVFARQIYDSLDRPMYEFGSNNTIEDFSVKPGFGSTDVGDVSVMVPTVGFETATWVPGTAAHSWQAAAASGSSIGFKGATVAAKVLALASIEILENAEIRDQARAEFESRRGDDFQYQPLIGDRLPPLDYRK